MGFLEAFNARIAADEKILGDSLKGALHHLEVIAAGVVAKCIQQHDVTPAAQELHDVVEAIKNAGLQAEKDVATAALADVKADGPQAAQTAIQSGTVVAADIAQHKTIAQDVADAKKVVADSPLAATAGAQAADIVAKAAGDAVDSLTNLGNEHK